MASMSRPFHGHASAPLAAAGVAGATTMQPASVSHRGTLCGEVLPWWLAHKDCGRLPGAVVLFLGREALTANSNTVRRTTWQQHN
jgi:hypothetical protein